ncbi:L-threonylcarbamoyladenylate synthase [Patescibacteria group bacterium]
MKKITLNDRDVYKEVVQTLLNGGVVMHPTETCYGLAVDIFDESALKKLYKIKEMDLDKPVSILVSDLEMAKEYGEFSEMALMLAKKYWPGPLSIVVPRTSKLPSFCNPENDFISIRCSNMDFCSHIVKDLKSPITTTSANVSTKPSLYKVDGLSEVEKRVDLIVDGGEIKKNSPSTIIKVVEDNFEVLRKGDLIIDAD